MNGVSAEEIRKSLIEMHAEKFENRGIAPEDVNDGYDLLREGIIDSLGILEMIAGLAERFGDPIDLEGLEAEELTQIGPLSRYLEEQLRKRA